MYKFKVGDRVKISCGYIGAGSGWVSSMDRYLGCIGTITENPANDTCNTPRYRVHFTNQPNNWDWWFPEQSLEFVTENVVKPRPHADLIHAWANGAKIQFYSGLNQKWEDIENPSFLSEAKYRIKPKEMLTIENAVVKVGPTPEFVKPYNKPGQDFEFCGIPYVHFNGQLSHEVFSEKDAKNSDEFYLNLGKELIRQISELTNKWGMVEAPEKRQKTLGEDITVMIANAISRTIGNGRKLLISEATRHWLLKELRILRGK